MIVQNQEKYGWGKSIVDKLSKDINRVIDAVTGYSSQNLWRMRQFYLEYRDKPDLLELTKNIPWGQNLLILHKIKTDDEKLYYLTATDKLAWSRAVLLNQIKAEASQRYLTDKKANNFDKTLPTIGIILCPVKDNIEVEFALRPSNKPIGVSEYSLTDKLPEQFKGKVPTAKELKKMLTKAIRNTGESEY